MKKIGLLSILLLVGCKGTGSDTANNTTDFGPPPVTEGRWLRPTPDTDWQIQLSGPLNSQYQVALYDVDLFDTTAAQIQHLQASGRQVICYFSAGTWENWRPDASQFRTADIGYALANWPNEYWLNINSPAVLALMQARLQLAADKGCDGVDPDNSDGYSQSSGFNIDDSDQLRFNRTLANSAHQLGLSVGLKNDLQQVTELVDYVDFAINESCFSLGECDLLAPFLRQQKPVFNIEYASQYRNDSNARQRLCTTARQAGIKTLILPRQLNDSFRYSCQ
ncbi:endo alpha-1,4 polygalactosaminidase [Gallaecimonas sp. GXIMD1310]|uniref:endo alpha-1,4 polygalactosaminidase n=1 Tax=Gallaecimonas sp. GXIMD1310 TaxID=3131926 RepID=UPI003246DD6F